MKETYDSECEICKILSNENRLKILMSLDKKGLTVSEIIERTKLPQSVVSQHLAMMKLREIVLPERKGKFIVYKIRYPEVVDAFKLIGKVNQKIKSK